MFLFFVFRHWLSPFILYLVCSFHIYFHSFSFFYSFILFSCIKLPLLSPIYISFTCISLFFSCFLIHFFSLVAFYCCFSFSISFSFYQSFHCSEFSFLFSGFIYAFYFIFLLNVFVIHWRFIFAKIYLCYTLKKAKASFFLCSVIPHGPKFRFSCGNRDRKRDLCFSNLFSIYSVLLASLRYT